jgi:hypothetical protein
MSILPEPPPTPIFRVELYLAAVRTKRLPATIRSCYVTEVQQAISRWEWQQILDWSKRR